MIRADAANLVINCSPQQTGSASTNRIMATVIIACVPAVAVATYFFGIGILLNILFACLCALLFESLCLVLRGKPVGANLSDNSALVTAVLLGIALPPGSPWWLILAGIFFAIVISKHAFGGLGQNIFNPAMSGYALLLLSFPLAMTSWHIPPGASVDGMPGPLSLSSLNTSLQFLFPYFSSVPIDGLAMATPLIEQKLAGQSAVLAVFDNASDWKILLQRSAETGWELVNFGFLIGGLFLLLKRIISWHIPAAIIGSIIVMSLLFYSPGSIYVYGTMYLHLFGSATMIAAFFIATDPVSAATSAAGKLIYGIIIGCSIYSIRVWGSYLDSVAFAVLFGNFCAPLIDYLTVPRRYGQ